MGSPAPLDIEAEYYSSELRANDAYHRFFRGHIQINLHSNGIVFVTLAPNHPILNQHLTVTSVEFSDQRLVNEVSGKKKRGGQFLQKNSYLCHVSTECGKRIPILASVDGKLLEINRELLTNPDQIKDLTKGFIAIFQSKHTDTDNLNGASPDKSWSTQEDVTEETGNILVANSIA